MTTREKYEARRQRHEQTRAAMEARQRELLSEGKREQAARLDVSIASQARAMEQCAAKLAAMEGEG